MSQPKSESPYSIDDIPLADRERMIEAGVKSLLISPFALPDMEKQVAKGNPLAIEVMKRYNERRGN